MSRETEIFQRLSDSELSEITRSFRNTTWDDDHIIRRIACEVYQLPEGEETVVHMLGLAVPVSLEWERRYMKYAHR